MIQERYLVYRVLDGGRGEREEVRGFYREDRALAFMARYPFPTTLDWLREEITRDGREILDCEADIDSRPGLTIDCQHEPVMIPGVGRGGRPAMVAAEGWCRDKATRRVTYKNGDVELLCGKHAGIARRFKTDRGGAATVEPWPALDRGEVPS